MRFHKLLPFLVNAGADDKCNGVICKNNGTCVDDINSYHCECIPGFTGDECQTAKYIRPFS